MKRLLLLLSIALPLLGQQASVYPDDYTPLPCAPKDVCKSFNPAQFAQWAGIHRRFPVRQEWVNAHWTDMMDAFHPVCAKIGSCLAVPGNDWVFCADFMRKEFESTADRYPQGTDDHDQWGMSALVFFIGLDQALTSAVPDAQKCALAQRTPGLRTLTGRLVPEKIDESYKGKLTAYTLDAETHVPVKAYVSVSGQTLKPADDSPDGRAMSFYKFPWPAKFNRVPNAAGHTDLVAPTVTLTAEGYEPLTMPIPLEVPKVVVEMQPPASKLVRGTNTITIVARDAATGAPVEMRVLAGKEILGKTNKPLTLELTRGKKRPEIWLTSLFDRYSDVVVVPAE